MAASTVVAGSSKYQDFAHDKRVIIYPVYLNSKASIADGRRIGAEHCVDNPTLHEILEVLTHLGYAPALEDKIYSRDSLARGRVRVDLKEVATGELTVPEIASRKQLLLKLGEAIPNLKSRKEPKPKALEHEAAVLGMPPMPMVPGGGMGMPAAMPGMMGPGGGHAMMPPGMAGTMPPGMPPGMAGMMPPGMAGMMPPGMAGGMPPGMAQMMQSMGMGGGMGGPQPGPGEGKVKGGKKKGRK